MTEKELTKQILNLAGYEIIFGGRVYTILKDGKKVQAGSGELSPKKAIELIRNKSYSEGVNRGELNIKTQLKALTSI